MKRHLLKSELVTLAILLSLSAKAYDAEINGIYYDLDTETKEATVTSGENDYDGDFLIPSTVGHDGITYTVTSIGNNAFTGSFVTSVSIPNSVTTIEDWAFNSCGNLTSLVIPNSVTSIGNNAFYYCSSLTAITIPNSVTTIGDYAFSDCSGLTSITIPNSVTTIGNDAFQDCSGLTEIIIPNSVAVIGWGAFNKCSSLTKIKIPNSVINVGNRAFSRCSSLNSITSEIEKPFVFGFSAFEYLPSDCILKVPYGTKDAYIAKGWTTDVFGGGVVEMALPKCETPTITLCANGNIKVECATEGAKCVTNITATHSEPFYDEEISLGEAVTVYNISAYATAEGYEDSEVAKTSFRWKKTEGDLNGDGAVNISDVTTLVNMILNK